MPNYAILVDIRDRPSSQITYVPEENIEVISNTKVHVMWIFKFVHAFSRGIPAFKLGLQVFCATSSFIIIMFIIIIFYFLFFIFLLQCVNKDKSVVLSALRI